MTRDIKINKASDEDLLAWYNENSGQKPRKKFKDRATAEKACTELREAIIELSGGSSKKGATAKRQKAEREADGEQSEGTKGRRATAAGKYIHRNVKDNPRRVNTHGYNSFELIPNKGGILYEDYIAQGGRNNDLRYDLEHGFVQLSDTAKPIKIAAPVESDDAAAE